MKGCIALPHKQSASQQAQRNSNLGCKLNKLLKRRRMLQYYISRQGRSTFSQSNLHPGSNIRAHTPHKCSNRHMHTSFPRK